MCTSLYLIAWMLLCPYMYLNAYAYHVVYVKKRASAQCPKCRARLVFWKLTADLNHWYYNDISMCCVLFLLLDVYAKCEFPQVTIQTHYSYMIFNYDSTHLPLCNTTAHVWQFCWKVVHAQSAAKFQSSYHLLLYIHLQSNYVVIFDQVLKIEPMKSAVNEGVFTETGLGPYISTGR